MIAFYRRIRQKLLANGKLSKYLIYAIGEIALVMIGILLALQVNNWSQKRNIKKIERTLLLDLREEFEYNDSLIQTRIRVIDQEMTAMKEALYYTGPKVSNITKLQMKDILNGSTRQAIHYSPSTSVVDDIINSGQLQYLTDKDLRRSLSEWGGNLNTSNQQELVIESYRSSLKQMNIEKSDMMTHFKMEGVFGLDSIDTGSSDFEFVYKDLLSDRRFENYLLYKIASTGSLRRYYVRLQSYMQSILEEIDQQIAE